MQITAVINQKGGVGKTTTTANLSYALAEKGYKVAVVDLDPQAHLTAYLGLIHRNEHGVGDVILNSSDISEFCYEARPGLTLLPAGVMLKNVESLASANEADYLVLGNVLQSNFRLKEYVFIDCPPASGILINYALAAANNVLVPVASDYLALRGLSDLVGTVNRYMHTSGGSLFQWLVITRYHVRRRLSREVCDKLLEYFPNQVLMTPIRETVGLAESPGFGKTIFEYRDRDAGATDYRNLADDFINKRFMQ